MGHVDRGIAVFVVQPAHFEAHFLAQIGIEIGQRLVKQQRFRIDHQCARQRHPLLLSTRQFARIARGEFGKPGRRQNRRHFARDICARQLAQRQPVGDVVGHRHVRPQRIALEDHRHLAGFGRQRTRRRRHRAVADHDLTRARLDEAGDQTQSGGFAAARGTEQTHQQAVFDAQRYIVHHRLGAISLGQMAQFNRCHARSPCPTATPLPR